MIVQSIFMLNMELITRPEFLIILEIYNITQSVLTSVFLLPAIKSTESRWKKANFSPLFIQTLLSILCTLMIN